MASKPSSTISLNKYVSELPRPTNARDVLDFITGATSETNTITDKIKLSPADIVDTKVNVIDVLKEVPGATKEVISKVGKILRSVQTGIAQSGASVALTLNQMGSLVKKEEPRQILTSEELDPQLRTIKEFIFGKDPLKSISQRIAESELNLKYGTGIPFVGTQVKTGALPLAFLGTSATVGLDFTGFGGKKNVVNQLTRLKKVDLVSDVLRRLGAADDLIDDYAKIIAKTNKTDDVVKALDRLDKIQKTTRVTDNVAKTAEQITETVVETGTKVRKFLTSVKNARPDIPLKIGNEYIPRSTDDLAIKARNLIKDSIYAAEHLAQTGTGDDAIATASELIKHYADEAVKATSEVAKDTFYGKAAELAHSAAERLTELGRSVQAASIMGRLTPEGMLKFTAKEIEKYNNALLKSKNLLVLTN